ncbi:unnamed protein product, partial [Owenia fusiformis]
SPSGFLAGTPSSSSGVRLFVSHLLRLQCDGPAVLASGLSGFALTPSMPPPSEPLLWPDQETWGLFDAQLLGPHHLLWHSHNISWPTYPEKSEASQDMQEQLISLLVVSINRLSINRLTGGFYRLKSVNRREI